MLRIDEWNHSFMLLSHGNFWKNMNVLCCKKPSKDVSFWFFWKISVGRAEFEMQGNVSFQTYMLFFLFLSFSFPQKNALQHTVTFQSALTWEGKYRGPQHVSLTAGLIMSYSSGAPTYIGVNPMQVSTECFQSNKECDNSTSHYCWPLPHGFSGIKVQCVCTHVDSDSKIKQPF